jgi:O-antigen/teichoic acid export membrane protein
MLFLKGDYEGLDVIFKIMAIVPFFVALGGIFGQLGLLALGNEKDKKNYQQVYIIAGITALISIFISIPLFGAIGAAVSLLITEVVVFGLMFWFGRKIVTGASKKG